MARMVNVEVVRTGTENAASLLRRFSRRVQAAGIIQRAKASRAYVRPPSKYARKKQALRKLERRARYLVLYKLGRVVERARGRRR